ncbi:MAG TPA: hypothetical protein VM536_05320, partial [Chloroflexia bacterium]|nr:hypothetical protein [Chloroflexia bacterium]
MQKRRIWQYWTAALIALLAIAGVGSAANAALPIAQPAQQVASADVGNTNSKPGAVNCADVATYHLEMQTNLRAAEILAACGYYGAAAAVKAQQQPVKGGNMPVPAAIGGTDANVILPDATYPKVTQSESFVWGFGNTVVVHYNDSRASGGCYAGISYSTDGGTTWTRNGGAGTSPICAGHGTNYGDPTVVHDNAHNVWVASDLATGCGGQGIGIWTSPDAITWTAGACAHNGASDDRQSHWVDNTPSSPYYGRQYITWNDYAQQQQIRVVTSTDGGTTWSAPVNITTTFVRNIQDTGSQDATGTAYVAGMDEQGGGLNNRINHMYKSINGGATWTDSVMGAAFPGPGRATSGYFALVFSTIWRHMGW